VSYRGIARQSLDCYRRTTGVSKTVLISTGQRINAGEMMYQPVETKVCDAAHFVTDDQDRLLDGRFTVLEKSPHLLTAMYPYSVGTKF